MIRQITCRKATLKDILIYYNWANEATVRKNAIHPEEIRLDDHKVWYIKKMKSSYSDLYFFKMKDKPLGQVRFDKNIHNDRYEIDYSIDFQYRGHGLGQIIIDMAMNKLIAKTKKQIQFEALVKKDNLASSKIFMNLGFSLINELMINDVTFEKYFK